MGDDPGARSAAGMAADVALVAHLVGGTMTLVYTLPQLAEALHMSTTQLLRRLPELEAQGFPPCLPTFVGKRPRRRWPREPVDLWINSSGRRAATSTAEDQSGWEARLLGRL